MYNLKRELKNLPYDSMIDREVACLGKGARRVHDVTTRVFLPRARNRSSVDELQISEHAYSGVKINP